LRRDRPAAAVEAALLVSTQPISSRRLGQVAGLADSTQARTLIRRLNEYYRRGGSAFRVEEVAGGWQLLTHPSFGGWLRRLHPEGYGIRLSSPALETLAVVAYRQPVLRADVESIRGVQCGEMLRQLMDRDLVRIVGKSHDLGRPFLYGTTPRFLQAFGLRHLDDLPRREQMQPQPPRDTQTMTSEVISGDRRDQDLPESTHDLKEEQHT
jgi:segregation and condensation protein B